MKERKIPVTVEIVSTVYHLIEGQENPAGEGQDVFIGGDEEENPDVLLINDFDDSHMPDAETARDAICYTTDGVLERDGNALILTYRESESMGMEDCVTVLQFDRNDSGSVIMTRSGSAATSMIFNMREPRQQCVYETGVAGFPLELCIRSRKVCSAVDENGGTVQLDYVIELRGVCTERTVLQIGITPQTLPETALF